MRRFQPHAELPNVTRFEIRPMTAFHQLSCFAIKPSQVNPFWNHHIGGCVDIEGGENRKSKSNAAGCLLRQGGNHTL